MEKSTLEAVLESRMIARGVMAKGGGTFHVNVCSRLWPSAHPKPKTPRYTPASEAGSSISRGCLDDSSSPVVSIMGSPIGLARTGDLALIVEGKDSPLAFSRRATIVPWIRPDCLNNATAVLPSIENSHLGCTVARSVNLRLGELVSVVCTRKSTRFLSLMLPIFRVAGSVAVSPEETSMSRLNFIVEQHGLPTSILTILIAEDVLLCSENSCVRTCPSARTSPKSYVISCLPPELVEQYDGVTPLFGVAIWLEQPNGASAHMNRYRFKELYP